MPVWYACSRQSVGQQIFGGRLPAHRSRALSPRDRGGFSRCACNAAAAAAAAAAVAAAAALHVVVLHVLLVLLLRFLLL